MEQKEIKTLQALARSLADNGDRPAIHQFRKRDRKIWSFAELGEESGNLAAGLLEAGLKPKTHALLFAPNSAEWIVACLALLRAGAVPVPIDAQMSEEEIAVVIEQSRPEWIFTASRLIRRLEGAGLDRNRTLVLLDEDNEERLPNWRRFLADKKVEPPQVDPEDRAVLFFTSGTSGVPKGVPLSHRNIAANLTALLGLNLVRDDDCVLLPLPLHHVYPFVVGLLAPFAAGVLVVLPYSLSGPQMARALRESGATAIIGVPRLYAAFYDAIERRIRSRSRLAWGLFRSALWLAATLQRHLGLPLGRGLFAPLRRQAAPSLRLLASGGSALDPELARKLEALGWTVASGYGLTETSPILTFNVPPEGRPETAGRPLPEVQIRIAPGREGRREGEVLAKGPNVFSGYHGAVEDGEVFTSDGFFKTGDLGYLDADGYLHLVGRASSMIVLPGGENVWPEKIEESLARSDDIREAGVFLKGDRLAAVIVAELKALGQDDGRKAIAKAVEERLRALPSHHRVAEYALVADPLPRTRLGKIRRHKLPEIYGQAKRGKGEPLLKKGPIDVEEMAPDDQALLEDSAAAKIWSWLAGRFTEVRLTPDLSLQDLGIDSMDWLNLTLEIRREAGVDLDDEAIGRIQTVRDLLREVAEAGAAAETGKDLAQLLERPAELLSERQRKWLEPPGVAERLVGSALLGLNRWLMRTVYRLEVRGKENLPDKGPFVLAPNHVSFLDPLAIGAALPHDQLARTYWGGWTGIMFANPVMHFISKTIRVVPVDPQRGPLSSLAFGAAALDAGDNLVWFPEGGRSKDGKLQGFRPGIGILLTARTVPLIPAWIEGSFEALPRGRWWPRLSRITITFGEAMDAREIATSRELSQEAYQRIADAIHDRVAKLAASRHG